MLASMCDMLASMSVAGAAAPKMGGRRRGCVGKWADYIYMLSEGFVLVFGLAGVQATCEGRGVCRLRSRDTHVRPGEIERILLFFISDSPISSAAFSPHLSAAATRVHDATSDRLSTIQRCL